LEERTLDTLDPEVAEAIQAEIEREKNNLVMIASENYASMAVIKAQANVMTNKYAEGYPKKRYYGGCENVDVVEWLAIERAKRLFRDGFVPWRASDPWEPSQFFGFFLPGGILRD
jgi:glycine hydroxymethyltransferase